jgi:hypothetical protein
MDPHLSKLFRALSEAPASHGALFRGGRRVDDLFDRVYGELLSAQTPARLAGRSRWRFDRQAQLDQAADGF